MTNERPETGAHRDDVSEATVRRNKAMGLALAAFVVILMVVSYFRISSLSP